MALAGVFAELASSLANEVLDDEGVGMACAWVTPCLGDERGTAGSLTCEFEAIAVTFIGVCAELCPGSADGMLGDCTVVACVCVAPCEAEGRCLALFRPCGPEASGVPPVKVCFELCSGSAVPDDGVDGV